jgi:hypothetical protein
VVSRENRHAIPGTLALPDGAITQGPKRTLWECPLLGFQLLEANDVWLGFAQPSHQVVQTLVDVVDVESDDLQSPGLNLKPIVI